MDGNEMNGKGKAALYAKLARVMGQVGEIEKRGRNSNFNYDFIRDVDVNNAIRPLLAEAGVAVLVGMDHVQQEEIRSGSGSAGYHTVAKMSITFADGETGATVTIPWYGEANDYQDKAINKCATAGLKYALLKTFLIGSDEDPDAASPARANGGSRRHASPSNVDVDLSTTVNFGKHKDKTLEYILKNDPSYLEWLAENWNWDRGRAMAVALLPKLKDGGNGGGQPTPPDGADGNSNGGGNPGEKNATDFWRRAKHMIASRQGFDSTVANQIKDNHLGDDGVDWDAAYKALETWVRPEVDEDIPF